MLCALRLLCVVAHCVWWAKVRAGVGEEGDRRNVAKRNAAIEAALVDLVECDVPDTIVVDQVCCLREAPSSLASCRLVLLEPRSRRVASSVFACLFKAKEKFARMMSEQREAGVSDEDLKQMITKEGFEKYKKVLPPPPAPQWWR